MTAGCGGGGPRRAARTADGANGQTAGLAPSAAPAADSGTTGATGQGGLPAPLPPDVGGAGLPPVVSRVATSDPVVFVTIDDGWTKDPTVLPFLAAHDIKVTAFLIGKVAVRTSPYWDALLSQGGLVEDHTVTHPFLAHRTLAEQKAEICPPLEDDQRLFGRRPTLFRPPYGSLDRTTVSAAGDCGVSAVVLWDAVVQKGKLRRALRGPLQRGDIILLHWGPGLAGDLRALVGSLAASGLHSALLEDYLGPSPSLISTRGEPPAPASRAR